ncbi:MAG: glycosyltransferase N-terminal domain-containing protein, partial [Thermodesulfobacteriota bacterium]|nr:glycosyltransferase N-terminal domain-containing protein [Thermodesulfobacteriota bacterium]
MMFPLYTLAYAGAALCAGPFYLVRGLRTGKYLWSLADRLGRVRFDQAAKTGPCVWIHALSLGEVVSASELAHRLEAEGYQVCLSTTTRSGYEAARERLSSTMPCLCFPLDWPPAVSRALNAVKPDLFILVETDIWPNFLAGLAARKIPALLVNGRVSPRSLAGYKMIKPLWTRVLGLFDFIACQSALDRERMLSLGARPDKVVVTGSLKHDRPIPKTGSLVRAALLAETGLPDGLWLVGGSTHPGEDEALLQIFQDLRSNRP